MLKVLKETIDKKIEELESIEPNSWCIYSEAKREIREYELRNRVAFNPGEYADYINHITDTLNI